VTLPLIFVAWISRLAWNRLGAAGEISSCFVVMDLEPGNHSSVWAVSLTRKQERGADATCLAQRGTCCVLRIPVRCRTEH
jgi:hypothetical protein